LVTEISSIHEVINSSRNQLISILPEKLSVTDEIMNAEQINQAAELLKDARINNRVIDCIPEAIRPGNLGEAYAVQDRLATILGWQTGGWFCACTNSMVQQMLGLNEPYFARLFNKFMFNEPGIMNAADYPPIVVESEFGFRLQTDLPNRSSDYTRREVEDAISTVHPTIEVVAGHLRDWPSQDVWSVIADNGTDGALVVGEGVGAWREIDLVNTQVTLTANGKIVREGLGANVYGDPIEALVWLANARSGAGDGLRAGDIHNTGTATAIYWIEPGDEVVANFNGLGSVRIQFT